MLPWLVFVLLLPVSMGTLGHPKYECGENGRFEYCIDGIPGCVVGCHCHPGYYFDTETKICEPNAKLVQDYRRLFNGEPTRQIEDLYTSESPPTPTTTISGPVHLEDVGKDVEDLGDWLYNQFFKTIENQIVNNTNTEKPLTRRAGNGDTTSNTEIVDPTKGKKIKKLRKGTKTAIPMEKSGRRKTEGKPRKKFKPRRQIKKDKKKKDNLRRKLLRISEDDSLFDSSSSEDSGTTDTSSESDTTDSSDSEGTSDEQTNQKSCEKRDKEHKKDGEHGHRKIIMINKKPKLPSFIFLPNLDTPFYPPLGLPPPAMPMPMYPMVPIPPVPPFPPYPGDECGGGGGGGGTTATTNSGSETTTAHSPDENTTQNGGETTQQDEPSTVSDAPDTTTESATSDTDKPNALRSKKRKSLRLGTMTEAPKAKKKHRKKPTPNGNDFMDDFMMKDRNSDNDLMLHQNDMPPGTSGDPGDVDFKYLAQLIHKMNDTKEAPESIPLRRDFHFKTLKPKKTYRSHTRRTMPERMLDERDDGYYSKLGQQIASLIRNIDYTSGRRSDSSPPVMQQPSSPTGPNHSPGLPKMRLLSGSYIDTHQHPVQIQPAQAKPVHITMPNPSSSLSDSGPLRSSYIDAGPIQTQPIFYEDSYAPRSFWERSVRSLFNHLPSAEPLETKNDNLYRLESKVVNYATTEQALSLMEIENVLTLMAKATTQLQASIARQNNTNKSKLTISSNDNLNINLLPQQMQIKSQEPKDQPFVRENLHRPLDKIIISHLKTNVGNAHRKEQELSVSISKKQNISPILKEGPRITPTKEKQKHVNNQKEKTHFNNTQESLRHLISFPQQKQVKSNSKGLTPNLKQLHPALQHSEIRISAPKLKKNLTSFTLNKKKILKMNQNENKSSINVLHKERNNYLKAKGTTRELKDTWEQIRFSPKSKQNNMNKKARQEAWILFKFPQNRREKEPNVDVALRNIKSKFTQIQKETNKSNVLHTEKPKMTIFSPNQKDDFGYRFFNFMDYNGHIPIKNEVKNRKIIPTTHVRKLDYSKKDTKAPGLRGVFMHNLKNTPQIDIKDFVRLQTITKNKLKEVSNNHHLPKVTWISPKLAGLISENIKRPSLLHFNAATYKKNNIITNTPLQIQIPFKSSVFIDQNKGGSYFESK